MPGETDSIEEKIYKQKRKEENETKDEDSEDECDEEGIGWNILPLQSHLKENEKKYCIKEFPVFTQEEKRLLATVAGFFQKKEGKAGKKDLKNFFKKYCTQNLILLEKKQAEYLHLALESNLFGFGPFDFFLKDEEIEEIAVVGTGKSKPLYVFHTMHGWMESNIFFSDEQTVTDIVNKMARPVGRRLSMNSPVLNATLPDGNRLSASINPVSFSGPSITIRKFRQEPFTPTQLLENKTFSHELMAFLWIAMQCDCSILIAGNTGSGKTSSLNALLSFVPKDERIVVVEETPEIKVQHKHFVKLNVVKEQSIGMQNLIVESLRMRPDRIIVGEVRSREEVSAFIDTLLAGQGKGSYATFHGQSVRESMNRMRSLGVLEIDLAAIDLVIVQRRWNVMGNSINKKGNMEVRHVVEVAELSEKNGQIKCNTLFKFDYDKGKLVKTGKSAKVFEKARQGFAFGRKGFEKEIERRAGILAGMQCSKIAMKEFFEKVNEF